MLTHDKKTQKLFQRYIRSRSFSLSAMLVTTTVSLYSLIHSAQLTIRQAAGPQTSSTHAVLETGAPVLSISCKHTS